MIRNAMYNYLPPNFLEKCHILMNFCSKCPGRYLKVLPSLWVTILGMVDCPRDHCTMVQFRGSGRAYFEKFYFNFPHNWLFSGYLETCILYVCIYWKIYGAVYGPNRYSINPLLRILASLDILRFAYVWDWQINCLRIRWGGGGDPAHSNLGHLTKL